MVSSRPLDRTDRPMNRRIRLQTSQFSDRSSGDRPCFSALTKTYTHAIQYSFGWRVSLALAKCRGSRSRGLESRTPKNATAPSPESKISLDLQKHKPAQDSLRARTIARVPHRPSQHSPDSPVSKMASSMTMASAARCVPALAQTTLALDARARTRPARCSQNARGFLSGWSIGPGGFPRRRRAGRRGRVRGTLATGIASHDRGSPVAVLASRSAGRHARRVRGSISGTSVSKRIISPSLRQSIAVCQVSRTRPAAPRRATRGTRAIPASRRLPDPGSARRARGRSRAHPATRPRRSPERRHQQPNTSAPTPVHVPLAFARTHRAGSLAFRRLAFAKDLVFPRLFRDRRPLVADHLLSPRHRSPRTSFRTLRPVATAL